MAVAAQDFLIKLEGMYGAGIFKAILESHDERFVATFQEYKNNQGGVKDFQYPMA